LAFAMCDVLAIISSTQSSRLWLAVSFRTALVPEGHAEQSEQRSGLVVGFGRGDDTDVHSFDLTDSRVVNFWKDQLIAQTQGVISTAIEGLCGQTAEVAHARQCHIHQPIEKFKHPLSAQRDTAANRHSLSKLEGSNRFLGSRDDWSLSCNLAQFVRCIVQQL